MYILNPLPSRSFLHPSPLKGISGVLAPSGPGLAFSWGGTNSVFGKPCFCPLPKRGRFDENGENDEFAFYPLKTRASLLTPPRSTKMTNMAGFTQAKAWFRKSRVCSSLIQLPCVLNTRHFAFALVSPLRFG